MLGNKTRPSARLGFSSLATVSTSAFLFGCVVYLDGSLDVGDDEAETSDDSEDSTDTAITMTSGDDDPISTDEGDGDSADTTTDTGDVEGCTEAIDILFVIDNSGSMGEEQSQLVSAIGSMVAALDLAGMDWRIGVTTTDNGNPWCPTGTTTPEGGKLVASSCRSRLGDFLFSDAVDVQDIACNDVCAHENVQMASTVIDGMVVEDAGPWVQRIDGLANTFTIEGDEAVALDPVEALRCILPQGVNGCGFESQLESMRLAVARSEDVNEDQFGFLREGAQLAVVIISDETDCSYNQQADHIFAQDGDKTFWTDPNSSFPTSGVCWNAGMECIGEGPEYEDCVARNKDDVGNILPDGNDPNAVLHPIARYTETLTALEQAKKAIDPTADVMVFGVVGVQLDGSLHFADSDDPTYQDSFGIGAGCTGDANVSAAPPGRMRDVIAEFDGTLHSICKPQYIDAFTTIANRVTVGCGE
jgi:hypothetical protein